MSEFEHKQNDTQGLLDKALQENDLFNQLETAAYDALKEALEFVWLEAGELVMKQGEISDSLAIVVLGRVRVVQRDASQKAQTLLHLGHGQTIGEIGLITDSPRTADVIASRDTLLAVLSRDAYHSLLKAYPIEMNQHFTRPIFGRLQSQIQGTTRVNSSTLSMIWLPVHDAFSFSSIRQQLIPQLHEAASVLVVDAELVATQYGALQADETDAASKLAQWLGAQEVAYDVVVYLADEGNKLWLRQCLRQADKIVVFADATAPVPDSETDIVALQLPEAAGIDRYLVLIQPDHIDRPTETIHWLNGINCRYHYHLKLGDPVHTARVARLLCERGIGLVLCGGSARAVAHIGVHQALSEARIPIDVVVGSSSGTMPAVGMAVGLDAHELRRRSGKGPKLQLTVPFSSLHTGFGVSEWLDRWYGDSQIEDCWLPTFVLIYNLTTGNLETRDTGSNAYLVRMAMALPGLFPPTVEETQVLVDGGIINFMPVDMMVDRPDIRTVIAVELVVKSKDTRRAFSYDGRISGWRILWNRLNPFAKKLHHVSIASVLFRSIVTAGIRLNREVRHKADYLIGIDVSEYGLTDFSRIPELSDSGYRQTIHQIEELGLKEAFHLAE